MGEKKTVTIYSYKKVWNVEKKIYSISNIALPAPVNPYDMLAFLGMDLFMLLLGRVIPITAALPAVLRFIAIPYGAARFLMRMKLDGKNPVKYLMGAAPFWLTEKGYYVQLFRSHRDKSERLALKWDCGMGTQK